MYVIDDDGRPATCCLYTLASMMMMLYVIDDDGRPATCCLPWLLSWVYSALSLFVVVLLFFVVVGGVVRRSHTRICSVSARAPALEGLLVCLDAFDRQH